MQSRGEMLLFLFFALCISASLACRCMGLDEYEKLCGDEVKFVSKVEVTGGKSRAEIRALMAANSGPGFFKGHAVNTEIRHLDVFLDRLDGQAEDVRELHGGTSSGTCKIYVPFENDQQMDTYLLANGAGPGIHSCSTTVRPWKDLSPETRRFFTDGKLRRFCNSRPGEQRDRLAAIIDNDF